MEKSTTEEAFVKVRALGGFGYLTPYTCLEYLRRLDKGSVVVNPTSREANKGHLFAVFITVATFWKCYQHLFRQQVVIVLDTPPTLLSVRNLMPLDWHSPLSFVFERSKQPFSSAMQRFLTKSAKLGEKSISFKDPKVLDHFLKQYGTTNLEEFRGFCYTIKDPKLRYHVQIQVLEKLAKSPDMAWFPEWAKTHQVTYNKAAFRKFQVFLTNPKGMSFQTGWGAFYHAERDKRGQVTPSTYKQIQKVYGVPKTDLLYLNHLLKTWRQVLQNKGVENLQNH